MSATRDCMKWIRNFCFCAKKENFTVVPPQDNFTTASIETITEPRDDIATVITEPEAQIEISEVVVEKDAEDNIDEYADLPDLIPLEIEQYSTDDELIMIEVAGTKAPVPVSKYESDSVSDSESDADY